MSRKEWTRWRLPAVGVLWLGCSTPDLGHTLFSCETDHDCAPGQLCAPFQGQLACQRAAVDSQSPCPGGSCEPSVGAAAADVPQSSLEESPLEVPAAADLACPEGLCAPLSLSPAQGSQEALPGAGSEDAGTDAGAAALFDASPDAGLPIPDATPVDAGTALPDAGIETDAGGTAAPPSVRYDFETSLEGWRSVFGQRPDDTLDGTEQSSELAHHGDGALRMIFDGRYTPSPGVSADNAFYGAYEVGAPPAGVAVSLWMLSTAADVSVEVYAQASPTYAWTTLATAQLPQNQWQEIRVTMPSEPALQFGIQVHSALDVQGFVYLDEIRW